jgi:hypothetical protein
MGDIVAGAVEFVIDSPSLGNSSQLFPNEFRINPFYAVHQLFRLAALIGSRYSLSFQTLLFQALLFQGQRVEPAISTLRLSGN